jgi:hypothetical protein
LPVLSQLINLDIPRWWNKCLTVVNLKQLLILVEIHEIVIAQSVDQKVYSA